MQSQPQLWKERDHEANRNDRRDPGGRPHGQPGNVGGRPRMRAPRSTLHDRRRAGRRHDRLGDLDHDPIVTESDGSQHIRDFVFLSRIKADDDRLEGDTTATIDWDFYDLDRKPRNRAGLNQRNLPHRWRWGQLGGTWTGIGIATDSWRALAELTGSGAYEGLTATLFVHSGERTGLSVVSSTPPTWRPATSQPRASRMPGAPCDKWSGASGPWSVLPLTWERLREPDGLPPLRIAAGAPLVRQTPRERGAIPPLQQRFQTTVSATRIVLAGVIVAPFGKILLAGVRPSPANDVSNPAAVASAVASATAAPEASVAAPPTTAPTPASAENNHLGTDIVPGVSLTVQEVEPGLYRVLSDGVRDLTGNGAFKIGIVAGLDGGTWLFDEESIFRLGDERHHVSPPDPSPAFAGRTSRRGR